MKKIKLGDPILRPLSDEQIESLNRRDLIVMLKGEQKIRQEYEKYLGEVQQRLEEQTALEAELKERLLLIAY